MSNPIQITDVDNDMCASFQWAKLFSMHSLWLLLQALIISFHNHIIDIYSRLNEHKLLVYQNLQHKLHVFDIYNPIYIFLYFVDHCFLLLSYFWYELKLIVYAIVESCLSHKKKIIRKTTMEDK